MDQWGNGAIGRRIVLVALVGPGVKEALLSLKLLSSFDLVAEVINWFAVAF